MVSYAYHALVLHGFVKWNTRGVSLGFQRMRMKRNGFSGVSLDFQCARKNVNQVSPFFAEASAHLIRVKFPVTMASASHHL